MGRKTIAQHEKEAYERGFSDAEIAIRQRIKDSNSYAVQYGKSECIKAMSEIAQANAKLAYSLMKIVNGSGG